MAKLPLALPEPVQQDSYGLPARTPLFRMESGVRESEPEQRRIPLAHYIWLFRRHLGKMIAFVAVAVVTTYILSSRLTPIYESTTTVDIEHQLPTSVVGQSANPTVDFDSDQFLSTQIRLIQSDSVLRPVAEKYRLLGGNNKGAGDGAADDAPVSLGNLRVTRPANTLLLLISYRSTDPKLAADVANGVANSYIEHTYELRYRAATGLSAFMEKQLEELKTKMERSGAALAEFEREFNVINPEEKTNILSARLLQLNTEYTNAQTDRLKKEATWNAVRTGSLEALQITAQGDSLKRLSDLIDDAQQKFAEVKTHYGPNHPEYRKAASTLAELQQQFQTARENIIGRVETEYRESLSREKELRQAVAETKDEFDHLNARSTEYQGVKQQAEADRQLYEELVKKIKEASINAGFQDGSIRIADLARPSRGAVFPRVKLNAFLAFLIATVLAVCIVIVSDLLDSTIRDAEEVRNLFRTDVLGTLPLVKNWGKALRPANTSEKGLVKSGGLREKTRVSVYEDAVRALRNSVLLSSFDGIKTLVVTSAGPSEGKTTTAANLAISHARKRHKTLLIDADLRRPGVANVLGIKLDSEYKSALVSGDDWEERLLQIEAVPDLDILAAPRASGDGVDLVGTRLSQILPIAEEKYDLIIIDSPPVLGFPEPLEMSVIADGVLLVASAGETDRRSLESALNDLRRLRVNVLGVVLNKVSADSSDAYYYQGYSYGKYYSS